MSIAEIEPDRIQKQVAQEIKIQHIQNDLREIKENLKTLADAVTKIAVFEEKSAFLARSLEELRERQHHLEKRVINIENEYTKFTSTVQGVSLAVKGVWAVFGASVVAAIGWLLKYSS